MRDTEYGAEGADSGWVSAASAHYVDVEAIEWTLPDEAFPLRAHPHPHAMAHAHAHTIDDHEADPHESSNASSHAGAAPASPGDSSGSGAAPAGPEASPPPPRAAFSAPSGPGDGGAAGEGLAGAAGAGPQYDAAPLLAAALQQHADLGDVQTAAVVCIALHEHRSDLFAYIDEATQEQWLLGYIELLQRNKLWNVATEVIRCAWLSSVWALSQQSTSVVACCGRCGRRTRPRAPCDRCAPRLATDLCAVCRQAVRGLYAWCQGCSHGGHLHHMRRWMQQHQVCPAGCGHLCELN
ncbi:GATOR complex protein WDR24 [Leptidea sinapis]|uniref:GATOR complex protein WDR24 n=1 Tax=Leptidea sinapis TaxID=189913 RepID=UPI0021458588|nr:GATOR complex protein WDR24 [Leptidea sinapis]